MYSQFLPLNNRTEGVDRILSLESNYEPFSNLKGPLCASYTTNQ